MLAALCYLVLTGIQVTNPAFDDELTTVVDYVNDGSFLAAMVLSVICLVGARGRLRWPATPVILAGVGQSLVSLGVAAGLVTGTSPDWFALVGLPGNLLAFVGYLWLGVWAWRHRAVPRWAAALLWFAIPVGVGVAEFGGSIVLALAWCGIGAQLLRRSAS